MKPVQNTPRTRFIVRDSKVVFPMGRNKIVTVVKIEEGTVFYTYGPGSGPGYAGIIHHKPAEVFYENTQEVI